MSGEMRRPPQLWEQRLARTTSVIAAGVGSGEATAIVTPTPPPGTDGGVEPAPVTPPPGDFVAPSQPTLFKQVQAINVLWDGLNSSGDLWPYDTSWVEIHMSTASGFTPGTATLRGRLARPGSYTVGGLTSGVTYYFQLRGADPAGNYTAASTQVSSTTGSASSGDIITIEGDQIIGGTITGQYIAGGTITGSYLSGGTISGGFITGGTVDGGLLTGVSIQTSGSGARVELGNTFGVISAARFFSVNGDHGTVGAGLTAGEILINPVGRTQNNGDLLVIGDVDCDTLYVDGANVDMPGVYSNSTTGLDEVGITTDGRLRRLASTQNIKYDMTALSGTLDQSVDADRQLGVATVTPTDILDLAVVEFSVIDEDEPTERRVLGFIAEDVAAKFPIAVSRNDDGSPAGVLEGSVLAALLAVVQQQHDEITDLRSRIEALEA
jgi:hypothetical protein